MRTTLSIDDDVLMAAKHMAEAQRRTLGEVISDLARQALTPKAAAPKMRNGVLLIPRSAGSPPVTPEIIRRLDEETP